MNKTIQRAREQIPKGVQGDSVLHAEATYPQALDLAEAVDGWMDEESLSTWREVVLKQDAYLTALSAAMGKS